MRKFSRIGLVLTMAIVMVVVFSTVVVHARERNEELNILIPRETKPSSAQVTITSKLEVPFTGTKLTASIKVIMYVVGKDAVKKYNRLNPKPIDVSGVTLFPEGDGIRDYLKKRAKEGKDFIRVGLYTLEKDFTNMKENEIIHLFFNGAKKKAAEEYGANTVLVDCVSIKEYVYVKGSIIESRESYHRF